ncbi:hypothetical protein [Nocardia jinanensis]|uniref:Uncharacterized protein n=1 Tax=Nocardia jinanensis TaxID=382504 RepID=A0A917S0B8_9NOCA|nr:hypothetical protein [Nocardia jinanensis]GGL46438.1 hypothetical protein GCM10011588_71580 [Nocardia jinanensis]
MSQGVKIHRYVIGGAKRDLLTIPYHRLPSRYPYQLTVPQSEIDRVLENRLENSAFEYVARVRCMRSGRMTPAPNWM